MRRNKSSSLRPVAADASADEKCVSLEENPISSISNSVSKCIEIVEAHLKASKRSRSNRDNRRAIITAIFDVNRYGNAGELSSLDWVNSLVRRRFMLDCFKDRPLGKATHPPEIATALAKLAFFPIGRYDFNPIIKDGYRSITDVSAYKAWRTVAEELAEHPDLVRAFAAKVEAGKSIRKGDDRLLFQKRLIDVQWDRRYLWIEVDLTATDDQLIGDFKEWLSRQREDVTLTNASKKGFTDATRGQWVRNRVLAYLDLQVLGLAFNVDLKQHEVASLLFPDETGIDVVERVRKVVKPLADSLISGRTIDTLAKAAGTPTPEEIAMLNSSGRYTRI